MLPKRYYKPFAVVALIAVISGCSDVSGRLEWEPSAPSSGSQDNAASYNSTDVDTVRRTAGLLITTPKSSFISSVSRCEVNGSFRDIPPGWRAYAVLECPYGFYLQWPPVRLDMSRKTFSQRNIRIADEQITNLTIVLANSHGAAQLDERASRNDWSAMTVLPDGVVVCDSITLRL